LPWRWVLANAVGELLGLGAVALSAAALVPQTRAILPRDPGSDPDPGTLVRAAGGLFAAGAIVGWVEGAFLVRRLSTEA